ncbi:MAG: hypothetical protein LBP50_11285 [Tannerella sp.]|jgi:hypothetical protein|nr:hypothetical protein [Tannerella sp.]
MIPAKTRHPFPGTDRPFQGTDTPFRDTGAMVSEFLLPSPSPNAIEPAADIRSASSDTVRLSLSLSPENQIPGRTHAVLMRVFLPFLPWCFKMTAHENQRFLRINFRK